MKTYLAYTRVSTVKQGERSSSLQEQKSAIEAYAAKHGLAIAGWFEEMETAAKLGRTLFTKMLSEIEKGHAHGLIIHKIDRSARNLKDWAHLADLMDRGIEVHFAHESLDMNTRGGRLSADIQAVVASDYIRNLRDEVRKGITGRLKQGMYPFKAPIGYLDQGKAQLKILDPDTAPLVRQMFELYATSRYSLDLLRAEMHRRGLSGPTGKPLSKNGTVCTLRNPFYVGTIRIKRTGETYEGKHEPLIRTVVFDQVQAVLDGRTYASPVKHGFTYRRLIKCALCGYSLIGERQKGHVYYRCHTTTCPVTSFREIHIEAELSSIFQRIAFSDDELRDMRDVGDDARVHEAARAEEQRAQITRALGLCDERLTRLTDAFLEGTLDKEMFEERKTRLITERTRLRESLTQPAKDSPLENVLKNLELGNTAYLRLISENAEETREIVQHVTSNLVADRKNLEITLRFPYDEVEKRRVVLRGALDQTAPRMHRADFKSIITAERGAGDVGPPETT